MRETLLAGGQACRPLIARDGLSAVLIEPADQAACRTRAPASGSGTSCARSRCLADRVGELKFGDDTDRDRRRRCRGARGAATRLRPSLLPGLKTPTKFRAIVNAHFRFDPPEDAPPILGVVGGLVEWLFAFPQRLSVTISNGDRLVDMPREELAQAIWRDVCKAGGVQGEAAALADRARAPCHIRGNAGAECAAAGAGHGVKNLFLAGDWTDTGLPATIEGSVRSGDRAADLVLARRQA